MRRAALATLALAVALAGCMDPKIRRANAVRVCRDGTLVGRDPKTGDLVFVKTSARVAISGDLDPGVTPEAFCEGAAPHATAP